ncbi:Thyroid adenoma-associated protein-like protein [Smittium culicis]|uniref:Thyroid adenoma-associated protein-like protein n=1 Tax=Smittium culicis TaxID=133412 RepID=A0A1R1X3G7_9FUNG|nr:Thyroid adenoma-associated protein-like protein [Smittium culicis]OMJ09147.1 Thyroid adenoma-associated protein-like protein [Smittium culicis]
MNTSETGKAFRSPISFWPGWLDVFTKDKKQMESELEKNIKLESQYSTPSSKCIIEILTLFSDIFSITSNFVSRDNESWEYQNTYLKQLEGKLGLAVKKVHKESIMISQLNLDSPVSDLQSMIFSSFLSTQDPIVRRLLLNTNKKLFDLDENLFLKTADDKLKLFILDNSSTPNTLSDLESYELSTFNLQPISTKASGLHMFLTMPFGPKILNSRFSEIFDHFYNHYENQIEFIQSQFNSHSPSYPQEEHGNFQSKNLSLFDIISSSQHVGKMLLLVITKSEISNDQNILKYNQKIKNLISLSKRLLFINSSSFGMESREISSLIIVSSLQILYSNSKADLSYSLFELQSVAAEQFNTPAAIICVNRAILSRIQNDVDILLAPNNHSNSSSTSNISSILQISFKQIYSLCGQPKLTPIVKVVTFESLSLWINKLHKLIINEAESFNSPKSSTNDSHLHSNFKSLAGSKLNNLNFSSVQLGRSLISNHSSSLLDLIWSYWEDQLDSVQHKVKDIFVALLDLSLVLDKFNDHHFPGESNDIKNINTDTESYSGSNPNFVDSVLHQIISMDWSQKIKYSLLAILSQKLGTSYLLSKQPSLILTALEKMQNPMLASRISTLISALLVNYSIQKKSTSKSSPIAFSVNQINPAVQNNKPELDLLNVWAIPISSALLNHSSKLTKLISHHILPIAFKTFPALLSLITANILLDNLLSSSSYKSSNFENYEYFTPISESFYSEKDPVDDYFDEAETNIDKLKSAVLYTAKTLGLITPIETAFKDLTYIPVFPKIEITSKSGYTYSKSTESYLNSHNWEEIAQIVSTSLKSAINNPSLSVRADLLGLLCYSNKISDPLYDSETDFIRTILLKSGNSQNAEFRQRRYSIMVTFAEKLEFLNINAWKKIDKYYKSSKLEGQQSSLKIYNESVDTVNKIGHILNWWHKLAIEDCLYPNSNFVRVSSGIQYLSIIHKYFSLAINGDPLNSIASDPNNPKNVPQNVDSNIISSILGKNSIDHIFNACVDSIISVLVHDTFESNRLAAFELLRKWPIMTDIETSHISKDLSTVNNSLNYNHVWLKNIVSIAIIKCVHTRPNDNEAGAYLLCFLLSKFVIEKKLFLNLNDGEIVNAKDPKILSFISKFTKNGLSKDEIEYIIGNLGDGTVQICYFLYQLVEMFIDSVELMKQNLLHSALKKPVTGLLLSIKLILSKNEVFLNPQFYKKNFVSTILLNTIFNNLIFGSNKAMDLVMSVLSNQSPEGNVPASFKEMELNSKSIYINTNQSDLDDAEKLTEKKIESKSKNLANKNSSNYDPNIQLILSYCWRVVKESAGNLATIVCTLPASDLDFTHSVNEATSKHNKKISLEIETTSEPISSEFNSLLKNSSNSYIISDSIIISTGETLFKMLTSIRHRGAFAAVYTEFAKVCKRIYSSKVNEIKSLIEKWLELCIDNMVIKQISITRRSAGWPYCLLALLSSDKDCKIVYLPGIVKRLFEISEKNVIVDINETNLVDLPQVHAINMLRNLFVDKFVTNDMIPFTEQGMVLALNGLESKHWAIKNACGLLFASLMERLFGIKKNKIESAKENSISARELFTKFPGLHSLIYKKLESASKELVYHSSLLNNHEKNQEIFRNGVNSSFFVFSNNLDFVNPSLYPILTLLSRLHQPNTFQVDSEIDDDYTNDNSFSFYEMPRSSLPLETTRSSVKYETGPLIISQTLKYFVSMVSNCSKSPVIKTRLMAADSLASILPLYYIPDMAKNLLISIEASLTKINLKKLDISKRNSHPDPKSLKNGGNFPDESTNIANNDNFGDESTNYIYIAVDYNDIHGKSVQVLKLFEVYLNQLHVAPNKLEYLSRIIGLTLPTLKHVFELTVSNNFDCEIVRTAILKIVLIVVGNMEWDNIYEKSIDQLRCGINALNSDNEMNRLMNEKLELEEFSKFVYFTAIRPIFGLKFTYSEKSTARYNDAVMESKRSDSEISVTEDCNEYFINGKFNNIIGFSDTILSLTKICLKLAEYFWHSSDKNENIKIQEKNNILELISNMLDIGSVYEVQLFCMDWIIYFIPKISTQLISDSEFIQETLYLVIQKVLKIVFKPDNSNKPDDVGPQDKKLVLASDPILVSKGLKLLFNLFDILKLLNTIPSSNSICLSLLRDTYLTGLESLIDPDTSVMVRCCLLNYVVSLYGTLFSTDISDKIFTSDDINNDIRYGFVKVLDLISEWSDEESILPYRESACEATSRLVLSSSETILDRRNNKDIIFAGNINAKVIISLFNLLFDDDEDIRAMSSETVSKFLSLRKNETVYNALSNEYAAVSLLSEFLFQKNYLNINSQKTDFINATENKVANSLCRLDDGIENKVNLVKELVNVLKSELGKWNYNGERSEFMVLFEQEPKNVYKESTEVVTLICNVIQEFLKENLYLFTTTGSDNTNEENWYVDLKNIINELVDLSANAIKNVNIHKFSVESVLSMNKAEFSSIINNLSTIKLVAALKNESSILGDTVSDSIKLKNDEFWFNQKAVSELDDFRHKLSEILNCSSTDQSISIGYSLHPKIMGILRS